MRFQRGDVELTLPESDGSPVLVQLWRADAERWCIGVTFDGGRQLLLFETAHGTTEQEALQIGSEMRAWLRTVHHVSDLLGSTSAQAS